MILIFRVAAVFLILCLQLFSGLQSQEKVLKNINFPINSAIKVTEYKIPSVNYAVASSLVVLDDYVVLVEQKSPKIISIFDKESFKYIGGYGVLGKGPNEFIYVDATNAKAEGNKLLIYDLTRGFLSVDINSCVNNRKLKVEILYNIPRTIVPLNDVVMLSSSSVMGYSYLDKNKDVPYLIYDAIDESVTKFGQFPTLFSKDREEIFWQIYNRHTVLKPDKQRFASFGNQVKMIRIYKMNHELLNEQFFKIQKDFFEGEWIRTNALKYYRVVKANNDYIFALCENQLSHDLIDNIPTLEVWDWDGNPVAKLELQEKVFTFDLLDNPLRIIAVDKQAMDKIYVYDLSDIID